MPSEEGSRPYLGSCAARMQSGCSAPPAPGSMPLGAIWKHAMTKSRRRLFVKLELAKLEAEKQHLDDMPENNHEPNSNNRHLTRNWSRWHMAHWVSHIVYVAAKLGLADHLANGPKSADEIAGTTGTHAPSLYRLMRTLANLGILTEDATHCFALTPLGDALKTGAPGSARATILTIASDWWVRGFGQLLYSVETGKSGFEKVAGHAHFRLVGEPSRGGVTVQRNHDRRPRSGARGSCRRIRLLRLDDHR